MVAWSACSSSVDFFLLFPEYGLTYRILGSVLLHEEYHMVNILQGACNHGRACQERRKDDPDEKPHDESVNPDKAVEGTLLEKR